MVNECAMNRRTLFSLEKFLLSAEGLIKHRRVLFSHMRVSTKPPVLRILKNTKTGGLFGRRSLDDKKFVTPLICFLPTRYGSPTLFNFTAKRKIVCGCRIGLAKHSRAK